MNLQVLISCMHEKDYSIIERTNIQTDVVVVNQCDEEKCEDYSFRNHQGRECHARFIWTQERGLSRSRNMALSNAVNADICLICDDDEVLEDNYENTILNAFISSQKAIDVAAFDLDRCDRKGHIANKEVKMGITEICNLSSVHLAIRRDSILKAGINFDEMMGSGTGNGGGEDIKFMMDCYRKKLNMRYFPQIIGKLLPSESQWYEGWNKKLMIDSGWGDRRTFGFFLGYAHILLALFRHRKEYKQFMTPLQAFIYLNQGFFQKR